MRPFFLFFQAEDGIRYAQESRGLGHVYKRQGVGLAQTYMATIAIAMGLNVRVGLEDNILYKRGELAKNNAQLVERVARIARELDREIATPKQTREMLGIDSEPKKY